MWKNNGFCLGKRFKTNVLFSKTRNTNINNMGLTVNYQSCSHVSDKIWEKDGWLVNLGINMEILTIQINSVHHKLSWFVGELGLVLDSRCISGQTWAYSPNPQSPWLFQSASHSYEWIKAISMPRCGPVRPAQLARPARSLFRWSYSPEKPGGEHVEVSPKDIGRL